MGGPLPLGWADMACWAEMTATDVRPAEWQILRQIDVAYLTACRKAAEWDRDAGNNPHIYSEQPMTADLFDAIFQ